MPSDWLFTAEGLAATLELEPGGPQGMSETARADFVSHQLGGLQRSPPHIQDPTYAQYAAKYMPQTIQKWRESQYVMAAAPLLLNELSHTPYFMRLALLPENQDLVAMQVRRTLADADTVQTLESEEVIRVLQFLSTLLLVQGTDNIPSEDKTALVARLQVWKRRFSHILAGEIAERCLGIINEDMCVFTVALNNL
ncbi:hypothetical protein EV715DRAFT_198292 [Schizophyllum commune]